MGEVLFWLALLAALVIGMYFWSQQIAKEPPLIKPKRPRVPLSQEERRRRRFLLWLAAWL